MVRLLARVIGVGIETADMLVQEVLSRTMRDRRAVARYAGLTGAPDESGAKRREKGLARSGNARVRRGMIQLAWRFLMFQSDSILARWFRARTENARDTRKTMIVALARKLLIALWRLVTTGEVPAGVVLRAAEKKNSDTTRSRSPTNRTSLVSDDDPRWRSPEASLGVDTGFREWVRRRGVSPPMRMDASWSGPYGPTGYKVAARGPRARQRAPLGVVIPTTTSLPPCSGLSRRGLETTDRAGPGRATADLDRPCARRPPTRVGRGEETGFQVEQRNWIEAAKWRMP
jgi:hypothetical protein